MQKSYDVIGVGSAIVDILSHCDDRFLSDNGITKSQMRLVDEAAQSALYRTLTERVEKSGGSVANTIAGVASLGGQTMFLGKVNSDPLGDFFIRDMRGLDIACPVTPLNGGAATASCIVLVTPDAERSMLTHLGAATHLHPHDVKEHDLAQGKVAFFEGYLLDGMHGGDLVAHTTQICKKHKTKFAFTLSDPWYVDRHRDFLHPFLKDHVDIVLGNQQEFCALFRRDNVDDAINIIRDICPFAAVTRGAAGSTLCVEGQRHDIDALPVSTVVDMTGAGDQYAAGVLFGYAQGHPPDECGRLGSIAAGHVIRHLGARPTIRLADVI